MARRRRRSSLAIAALLATGALATSASAAPPARYVSTTGKDSSDGSKATPWRTFAKAATAPAGTTVTILAGTYAEDVTLATSATKAAPTTFLASGVVTIRSLTFKASHLVVQGLTITGASSSCVTIAPALTNLTLRSNTIKSCGKDGVAFTKPTSTQAYTSDVTLGSNAISAVGKTRTDANDLTVYGDRITVQDNDLTGSPNDAINLWGDGHVYRHNRIHDISNVTGNHADAFQTWTGTGDGAEGRPATNLLVERNTVENVAGADAHCLMSEGPGHQGWVIRSNLFRNIGDQCLVFGKNGNGRTGVTGLKVSNNTFVAAGANNTIEFNLTSAGSLASNVFYKCVGYGGAPPYHVASTASIKRDYNLSGGGSPKITEAHGRNVDPAFVNAAAANYHLTRTSPAVNAADNGAVVSPVPTADLDGTAVSGPVDIGAYEYR